MVWGLVPWLWLVQWFLYLQVSPDLLQNTQVTTGWRWTALCSPSAGFRSLESQLGSEGDSLVCIVWFLVPEFPFNGISHLVPNLLDLWDWEGRLIFGTEPVKDAVSYLVPWQHRAVSTARLSKVLQGEGGGVVTKNIWREDGGGWEGKRTWRKDLNNREERSGLWTVRVGELAIYGHRSRFAVSWLLSFMVFWCVPPFVIFF